MIKLSRSCSATGSSALGTCACQSCADVKALLDRIDSVIGVAAQTNRRKRKRGGQRKVMFIDWDAVDLGERCDAAIAEELGVTRQCVSYQRRMRGIPAGRGGGL